MRMAENESTAQPVGLEYIEEDRSGKVIQFHCKLCDCKFNDPNAKEMHLKGRRHRLQYKKKVDPSLDVDMKPSIRARRVQDERSRQQRADFWRRRDLEERMAEMQAMEWSNYWGVRPSWPPGSGAGPMRAVAGAGFPANHHQARATPPGAGGHYAPRAAPHQHFAPAAAPASFGPARHGLAPGKRVDTVDDKHVQAKHASIYPSEEELKAVQHIVSTCEKALKLVSDDLADEDAKATAAAAAAVANGTPAQRPAAALTRQLKGVVRVGALANGLMLHQDLHVELVLLSAMRPSLSFLSRVHANFLKQIKAVAPDDSFDVHLNAEGCGFVVRTTRDPVATCSITFTSPLLRDFEENSAGGKLNAAKPTPPREERTHEGPNNGDVDGDSSVQLPDAAVPNDPLDADKCLAALAALRHAKWFQAKCSGRQTIVIIIRVMRDLCARVPTWSPLGQWPLELLVEKVVSSAPPNLGLGEALRRLFECIAAGTFLASGPGLLDPCEREQVDALAGLSPQEREDITASAQHALRLIAFRQIHKVLDMEPLPPPGAQQPSPPQPHARGKLGNGQECGEKRPGDPAGVKGPAAGSCSTPAPAGAAPDLPQGAAVAPDAASLPPPAKRERSG